MNDSLMFAAGEGLRVVAADSVAVVIHNCGGALTVPSLPETDRQFVPTNKGVIGEHPPGLVLRLNGSLFLPSLTNEDAGLLYMYSNGNPSNQFSFGAGLGITLVEPLNLFCSV
jgi:hypothetical protein